ncbi:trypsin-like serine peptidase [Jhaorihella thermophila]|uniref:Trypsin-like peptidase domain-containing protein n=1 Tax=Jhaorihella thermophila TaxID=488547 RepID=A0A1H5WGE5_9RHOB|nr:trypsin-like peptidase domain-containing protein [Jhaorihella thermophila]SEF98418.1 Trypsin-like peptidase domain-containing protein [Jhaorihella thermophila]
MRAFLAGLAIALLPVLGAAENSRLQSLDTTDTGRAWEAVGRLDINGAGFCTGTLIAPDLVLTAAHCLYDKRTGRRIDPAAMEFRAGWRNGRASAYRRVRQAVAHPGYVYDGAVSADRVRHDVALLELDRPVRNTTVLPFTIAGQPRRGARVGVVSYAKGRAEAPSLQRVCDVMARQQGVVVMSCDVDFGSSGAPVFSFDGGVPRIVSVVSAKAEMRGARVALGSEIEGQIALLQAQLSSGRSHAVIAAPGANRVRVNGARNRTGARFIRVKPAGSGG